MSIPSPIRAEVKALLWKHADEIGWLNLNPGEKSKYYEIWTRDPNIGGVLSRFMDKGKVRVYIKDTLLKDYSRVRLSNAERPLRVLGIDTFEEVIQEYEKPHGRRLRDGRVFCWGRADDWKAILMAIHERAFTAPQAFPFAAVLLFKSTRFDDKRTRQVVEDAATKLCIKKVVWLD
jgi:hypothetical protein